MLFIKQLLINAGLLRGESINHSVACISTTRPIYLVFDHKADHPVYVVRKLDDEHAIHTNEIHNQLYQLVGDQVPEPVGVYLHGDEKFDVQKGVQGSPWFQIKAKVRTAEARAHLEQRLWQTLNDFQAAICADTTHTGQNLNPHEELHRAYTGHQHTHAATNQKLEQVVGLAMGQLSDCKPSSAIPQHGDFCLNNLIIDNNRITVIDFEDFMITTMPMYDHFTLALSLPSGSTEPADAANIFNHYNLIESANALGIPETAVKWHFLHHLLLRLGPWSMGEKRAPYRIWLTQVLDIFVKNQF